GNSVKLPGSPLDSGRTVTANIALELGYAMDQHRAALFACGLILMGFVVLLISAAELVSHGRIHG
ncbi:MAG: phosphate ABC transporter permease subunit PstC, partial [Planctomycetes bacterium]|nr:phosphate ABC transporter permease subunit PstC [Planctomycetota bacterium]